MAIHLEMGQGGKSEDTIMSSVTTNNGTFGAHKQLLQEASFSYYYKQLC